jgi:hypothetical protein
VVGFGLVVVGFGLVVVGFVLVVVGFGLVVVGFAADGVLKIDEVEHLTGEVRHEGPDGRACRP